MNLAWKISSLAIRRQRKKEKIFQQKSNISINITIHEIWKAIHHIITKIHVLKNPLKVLYGITVQNTVH